MTRSYPWYTPYQFAGNKPIYAIDLDGLEEKGVIDYIDHTLMHATPAYGIPRLLIKNDGNVKGIVSDYIEMCEDFSTTTYAPAYNTGATFTTGVANAVTVYIPQTFGGTGGKGYDPIYFGKGANGLEFSKMGWGSYEQQQTAYNGIGAFTVQTTIVIATEGVFNMLEPVTFKLYRPNPNANKKLQVDVVPVKNNKSSIVDITSERRDHILNRHKSGAGKPEKTEFPSNWSDDKIIDEINKIGNDPNAPGGMGKWESPYKTGTVEGIDIRVDFYPNTHPTKSGKVSTGYPTNTPENPK